MAPVRQRAADADPGRQGSLYGAVVGAFAFVALQEIYSSVTTHWQLLLGGTIILLVLFLPGGLASRRPALAAPRLIGKPRPMS